MKIGILTLPFNNNYGGLLQSYALQTYLKNNGHDVILIQKFYPVSKNLAGKVKSLIKIVIGLDRKEKRDAVVISKNMNFFFMDYMISTPPAYTNDDLQFIKDYKFDAIIVGSDQVWRFDYILNSYKNYFLDFTEGLNLKRIAYAASFGVNTWTLDANKTVIVKNLIEKFNAVSVREDTGVVLCDQILKIKADWMPDPAFLLAKEDYSALYENELDDNSNKGKLLIYFLDKDDEKNEIAERIKLELSVESFNVGVKETSKKAPVDSRTYPPVWLWIKGFEDAYFVVTDSFHGCVFAIIFNKPFVVIGNPKRGMSRFESLLKLFDLKERLIVEDVQPDILYKIINFDKVNAIIRESKLAANLFLKNALNATINEES